MNSFVHILSKQWGKEEIPEVFREGEGERRRRTGKEKKSISLWTFLDLSGLIERTLENWLQRTTKLSNR